jgi:spermidine synthase
LPGSFRFLLYALVLVVGTLVGLEIPLVMRILKRNVALKDLVSQVLTFDYLGCAGGVAGVSPGAGAATGADPHRLAVWPDECGRGAVGAVAVSALKCECWHSHALGLFCHAGVLWVQAWMGADHITSWAEDKMYQDRVVFSSTSPYQRIVVTYGGGEGRAGYRLFLNGNLQFAQRDEYRYHEALVHPAMAAYAAAALRPKKWRCWGRRRHGRARNPQIPGCGKRHPGRAGPGHDPELFTQQPLLARLNGQALKSPKVKVINLDAFSWLETTPETFDVIVVDFPDPTNFNPLASSTPTRFMPCSTTPGGQRLRRDPDHLAAGGAQELLDGGEHHRVGGPDRHALPRPCAQLWRVGLCAGQPQALPLAQPRCPQVCGFWTCTACPTCSNFRWTWRGCPPRSTALSNQVLVTSYEAEWGRVGH